MRKYIRFAVDLTCVGLSPFLALFIRDNFDPSLEKLEGVASYGLLCVIFGALVISAAQLHKRMWRYTSLVEVLHLIAAASAIIVIAISVSFVLTRSEDIARSLPVIQWLLLIAAMLGTRTAVCLWEERRSGGPGRQKKPHSGVREVLIVGVNDVAELYLRSIVEFAPARFSIVGILAQEQKLYGRLMRFHKVLGTPEQALQIISQLEIHGVSVERLIVTQPFEEFSKKAQEALLMVEQLSAIKVEWLMESLGLREYGASNASNSLGAVSDPKEMAATEAEHDPISPPRYHFVKRFIDLAAALCLILILGPVIALLCLLVAIDVGLPLVFWQQRPGWQGRPFKLFKFRTMRASHDAEGNRIPDELRSSNVSRLLRRSRLDELPQLYNILVGEMSFIGPRPLLPIDQPEGQNLRQLVRPGLTGWAQVNGGRDISPEDKAALDAWYIMNASLWLDLIILLRTLLLVAIGERENGAAVNTARAALQQLGASQTVEAASLLGAEASQETA
jgi:lipopolysaccharide/colanic/teichoic acid biosynthesis glycosyltransferase